MTTQADFLIVLRADPLDSNARLIYADLCEECGDVIRADFHRKVSRGELWPSRREISDRKYPWWEWWHDGKRMSVLAPHCLSYELMKQLGKPSLRIKRTRHAQHRLIKRYGGPNGLCRALEDLEAAWMARRLGGDE